MSKHELVSLIIALLEKVPSFPLHRSRCSSLQTASPLSPLLTPLKQPKQPPPAALPKARKPPQPPLSNSTLNNHPLTPPRPQAHPPSPPRSQKSLPQPSHSPSPPPSSPAPPPPCTPAPANNQTPDHFPSASYYSHTHSSSPLPCHHQPTHLLPNPSPPPSLSHEGVNSLAKTKFRTPLSRSKLSKSVCANAPLPGLSSTISPATGYSSGMVSWPRSPRMRRRPRGPGELMPRAEGLLRERKSSRGERVERLGGWPGARGEGVLIAMVLNFFWWAGWMRISYARGFDA